MRTLIITMGSSGDVNPFIALGLALRGRGHAVRMLVNHAFVDEARAAGLDAEAFGEPMAMEEIAERPDMMHPRRGPEVIWNELIVPYIPHTIDALSAAFHESAPDVVIAHPICIAARWVSRAAGIPVALGVLSPMIWFSRDDQLLFRQWEPARPPGWYVRLRHRVLRALLLLTLDRQLNRLRQEHGYPAETDPTFRSFRDGDLNLALWSPHFRGTMSDDPSNSHVCGFAWYDRHAVWQEAVRPPDLDSFLDRGAPPIIFTLGSSCVHLAGQFYDHAAEACQRLNRRGLLLIGTTARPPTDKPDGVLAVPYAPHSTVFPRGCAIVHHGGVGTTAQALRAGRPTVIVPFSHDQFDNAARTCRLGVSTTLKRARVSGRALAHALGSVLENAEMKERAARLGRLLAHEDGAARAAIALERQLAQYSSSTVAPPD